MENTFRTFHGGLIVARYWYVWKATFANFITLIMPCVNLTCTKRNRAICVLFNIFVPAFHLPVTVYISFETRAEFARHEISHMCSE